MFLRWGAVGNSPNPQAGGPPLVGCPRLLIQYIRSCHPYWRPFLHPQPEDAPCRGDRDPLTTASCTAWPLKMETMCFPEMSVTNYQFALRNILEEGRSHFHCGGSLKSRRESYAVNLTGWGTKWSWPISQYYHHSSHYVKKCLCNLHFPQGLRKNICLLRDYFGMSFINIALTWSTVNRAVLRIVVFSGNICYWLDELQPVVWLPMLHAVMKPQSVCMTMDSVCEPQWHMCGLWCRSSDRYSCASTVPQ